MLPLPTSDLIRRPTFTVADFFLIVLGGVLGALLGTVSIVFSDSQGTVLVVGLLGQQLGHIAALGMVMRYRQASLEDIGLEIAPSDGIYVLVGLALQLGLLYLFLPLTSRFADETSPQALTELVPEVSGVALQAAMVLSIALLAPVVEEVMFRSVLSQAVGRRLGALGTILTTAGIFALFHLASVDLSSHPVIILILVLQLFIVGVILARMVQRRGRLGTAIFTHAGFNLVAVIALLVAPELVG
jgi:membrane protease YdiL (CAAX protease family)